MTPAQMTRARPADGMRSSLAFSIAVHAAILAVMIFGLPYFRPKPKDVEPMISVELVQVGKQTTTNKVSNVNKVVKQPQEEQPAPPTPPPPQAQPTPPQPEQPPEPKPEPRPDPQPAPKVPDISQPTPELKVPDLVVKAPLPDAPKLAAVVPQVPELTLPPKPDFKKVPPKPATPNFDALLKNLTKEKPQPIADQPPVPKAKAPPTRASGAQAPMSANLTASELSALSAQLGRCWSIPAAAKDAQDLVVDIDVTVGPDRVLVGSPVIDDQGRMGSDPAFRAAAMAAVRALRNPQCSPLELPPDKYQQWQTMTIHFDPKEMLGQ
jgi:outer membrane biosynthesis protein TonB